MLPQGTEVMITQSLGGSYTLMVPSYGGLFRLSNHDSDAIGKETRSTEGAVAGQALTGEALETELVRDQGLLQRPVCRLGYDEHAEPHRLAVVHRPTRRRLELRLFPAPEQQAPDQEEDHGAHEGDDSPVRCRNSG